MNENTTPSSSKPPQTSGTITRTEPSSSEGSVLKRSHLVAVCGAALVVAFFLPWLRVVFVDVSGFAFAKRGDVLSLFWAMPIFGLIACIAGVTDHKSYKAVAAVAGVVPFAILCYGISKTNADLFKALNPGAWLGLAAGVGILVSAAAGRK